MDHEDASDRLENGFYYRKLVSTGNGMRAGQTLQDCGEMLRGRGSGHRAGAVQKNQKKIFRGRNLELDGGAAQVPGGG
jgi:hypothetical protein